MVCYHMHWDNTIWKRQPPSFISSIWSHMQSEQWPYIRAKQQGRSTADEIEEGIRGSK